MFLGSSCIYPRLAPQPIPEDALLTGPLEPTNEWYAIAKIAGLKLCQAYRRQYGCDFISAMPTNLYGPGDNFDPAIQPRPAGADAPVSARRSSRATPRSTIWGTGTPRREFLHVDDLRRRLRLPDAATIPSDQHVNIGSGRTSPSPNSRALVAARRRVRAARSCFDRQRPDGTPRKLVDVSKLTALGWKPRIDLEPGIREVYRWYLENGPAIRLSASRGCQIAGQRNAMPRRGLPAAAQRSIATAASRRRQ